MAPSVCSRNITVLGQYLLSTCLPHHSLRAGQPLLTVFAQMIVGQMKDVKSGVLQCASVSGAANMLAGAISLANELRDCANLCNT